MAQLFLKSIGQRAQQNERGPFAANLQFLEECS